jgi:hypothetical protein
MTAEVTLMDILMTLSDGLPRVNETGDPDSEQDWEGIRRIATGEDERGFILVRSSITRAEAEKLLLGHDNPDHPLHERNQAALAAANKARAECLAMGATDHEAWCGWRYAYNTAWRACESTFPAPKPNFPMPAEDGNREPIPMGV